MPVDDVPPQGLIHRIELHSVGHIRVWRAYAVDPIHSIFLVHAERSRFSVRVSCAWLSLKISLARSANTGCLTTSSISRRALRSTPSLSCRACRDNFR